MPYFKDLPAVGVYGSYPSHCRPDRHIGVFARLSLASVRISIALHGECRASICLRHI
jgi:hypothetical protein